MRGWPPSLRRGQRVATQRDGVPALRCHALTGPPMAALTARAASGAGRTPCNSPGGDGGEAEGRTLFAALRVDARGGREARSACRQCPPRAQLERSPGTSRRCFPACAVPASDPCQRASGPCAASPGRGSHAIQSGAGWGRRAYRCGGGHASGRRRVRLSCGLI